MARRATGSEVVERARRDIAEAKSLAQLRTAQAVLLPLELNLSLQQTAMLIGRSPAWVARERRRYITGETLFSFPEKRGGRRNQLMTEQEELEIVKRGIMQGAYHYDADTRDTIRNLLEKKVGREIAESTFNAILSRVARKVIPGGTASDLTRLDRTLTEKWMRERVLVEKRVGDKFAV